MTHNLSYVKLTKMETIKLIKNILKTDDIKLLEYQIEEADKILSEVYFTCSKNTFFNLQTAIFSNQCRIFELSIKSKKSNEFKDIYYDLYFCCSNMMSFIASNNSGRAESISAVEVIDYYLDKLIDLSKGIENYFFISDILIRKTILQQCSFQKSGYIKSDSIYSSELFNDFKLININADRSHSLIGASEEISLVLIRNLAKNSQKNALFDIDLYNKITDLFISDPVFHAKHKCIYQGLRKIIKSIDDCVANYEAEFFYESKKIEHEDIFDDVSELFNSLDRISVICSYLKKNYEQKSYHVYHHKELSGFFENENTYFVNASSFVEVMDSIGKKYTTKRKITGFGIDFISLYNLSKKIRNKRTHSFIMIKDKFASLSNLETGFFDSVYVCRTQLTLYFLINLLKMYLMQINLVILHTS